MYFVNGLACITLGTLVFSGNPQLALGRSTSSVPVRTYSQRTDSQPTHLPNIRRSGVFAQVKLLPYEILAGKATSYADISLTVSNTTGQPIEVEVKRLEIMASDSQQVLMNATPQMLQLPNKITLKSKESKVLEYRLQSQSQLYQRGQNVIAQIHYQVNGQPEQVVYSSSETVALMIP
jgi:hypothetical protein